MEKDKMKITATFIDFSERTNEYEQPLQRDTAFWQAELGDLQAAGITDLVIARSMVRGRAHYHSALFEEWSETDAVAQVMAAGGSRGLDVFCAPFFSESLSPAELAAWWDGFLDRPMFDILAMQDGVGCRGRAFCEWDRAAWETCLQSAATDCSKILEERM